MLVTVVPVDAGHRIDQPNVRPVNSSLSNADTSVRYQFLLPCTPNAGSGGANLALALRFLKYIQDNPEIDISGQVADGDAQTWGDIFANVSI